MCLICIEYKLKKMTLEEVKRALPEMIQFAKNETEKKHFLKIKELQEINSEESLNELNEIASLYVKKNY